MRGPLLLILTALWLYAPDMALAVSGDPSAVTYQANGLYGAVLALYALTTRRPPGMLESATLAMSALLWALQFGCDLFWTKAGPSAAICDDVTNRPVNLICAATVLGVAALADRLRGRDA